MSISNLVPEDEQPKNSGTDEDPKATGEPSAVSEESAPEKDSTPVGNASSQGEKQSDDTSLTTSKVESVTEPTPEQKAKDNAQEITDALFARMAPIGSRDNLKLMIYGPPGGGKSTFLNVPNNLIYDQEKGLISIKTYCRRYNKPLAENVQAIPFRSFAQSELLLDRLEQNVSEVENFEVFSIDTMNDFHKRALSGVVKREHSQRPSSLNEWVPETEHHQENNERILSFVRRLRDLDKNIILTAHSKTVEPKNGPTKTYPDFSESLANKIEAMMDIVGYMEMREIDGKTVPVMRIVSDGIIHAKSRVDLPDEIANPTYAQLHNAWVEANS